MEDKASQTSDRLLDYGVAIIKICTRLNRTAIGKHIGNQLLRSGTSVGANYEEARGANSLSDFKYKLSITLKELRESLYWIKLLRISKIYNGELINELHNETVELCKIITCSLKTIKNKEHKLT